MAVQNALEEGTLVKNRYEIQKILTLGGNKIIYEAYDCDQGKNISLRECFLMNVCCRFPDQTLIHVPRNHEQKLFDQAKEEFQRYCQMMISFQPCPNLRRVYDFFEENGTYYLAQELLTGRTLKQYMKEEGVPLPEKEIRRIAEGVLNALRQIHKNGYLHTEVYTGSILIMEDGTVKLAGLDGAVKMEDLDHAWPRILTMPGYSPPEKYSPNGKIGPWTDLYALGAALYEMSAGERPEEAAERLKGDRLVPPKNYNPHISNALSKAIMKALSLDVSRRYQTAEEFYQDIAAQGQKRYK